MIRAVRLAAAGLLWGLATGPAGAQTLGQGESTDIPWLRLIAALLLCLGLAAGAAIAIRRRLGHDGGGTRAPWAAVLERLVPQGVERPAARLRAIETRRLSPQVSVSVFSCDGRDFLVASTAQGQIVLVSLEDDGPEGR